jgi:hypothetical protein
MGPTPSTTARHKRSVYGSAALGPIAWMGDMDTLENAAIECACGCERSLALGRNLGRKRRAKMRE